MSKHAAAKERGFTHRWKKKRIRKYLKLWKRDDDYGGAIYLDEDDKFRYIPDEEVEEL